MQTTESAAWATRSDGRTVRVADGTVTISGGEGATESFEYTRYLLGAQSSLPEGGVLRGIFYLTPTDTRPEDSILEDAPDGTLTLYNSDFPGGFVKFDPHAPYGGLKDPSNCDNYQTYTLNRTQLEVLGGHLTGALGRSSDGFDLVRGGISEVLALLGFRETSRGEHVLPDLWAVALDETDDWDTASLGADARYVKRIEGCYIFDRASATNLCEITPSYSLYHYDTRAIFQDDAPDDAQERIDEFVSGGAGGSEDTYVHCHTIDAILEKGERFRSKRIGGGPLYSLAETEGGYDAWMEANVQACRENAPL